MKVIIYEIDEGKEKICSEFSLIDKEIKYEIKNPEHKKTFEEIIIKGISNFKLNKKVFITEGKLFLESLLLYFRGSYFKAVEFS